MSWTDGECVSFDNEDVVVHVKTHPRLGCIDVYYWCVGRVNHKFIGRYDDSISEWELRRTLAEDNPKLNLVFEETEKAECGIEEDE